jgi:hypothetical protein
MQAESEEKSNPTDAPQTTESPATSADPETAESATATGAEAPQASDPVASPPATPAAESEATATGEPRRQIKIGSRQQRDGNTSSDSGTEPSVVAGTNSTAPNPIPTVRDPLPADLEKEIEEALENANLDEIVASEATMQVGDTLSRRVNSRSRQSRAPSWKSSLVITTMTMAFTNCAFPVPLST